MLSIKFATVFTFACESYVFSNELHKHFHSINAMHITDLGHLISWAAVMAWRIFFLQIPHNNAIESGTGLPLVSNATNTVAVAAARACAKERWKNHTILWMANEYFVFSLIFYIKMISKLSELMANTSAFLSHRTHTHIHHLSIHSTIFHPVIAINMYGIPCRMFLSVSVCGKWNSCCKLLVEHSFHIFDKNWLTSQISQSWSKCHHFDSGQTISFDYFSIKWAHSSFHSYTSSCYHQWHDAGARTNACTQ